MNKFICLGAHNGDMVRVLNKLNTKEVLGVENINWDEIHLFEPQPEHSTTLLALQKVDNRIHYHAEAAYIEDTSMDFYIRGSLGNIGSTLDNKKHSGDIKQIIKVNAVDFIKWLENNTDSNDFIFLDMDIECGEYYIMTELIKSPIRERIDFLSIEWHHGKSTTWLGREKIIEKEVNEYFGNRLLNHDLIIKNVINNIRR